MSEWVGENSKISMPRKKELKKIQYFALFYEQMSFYKDELGKKN